MEYLDESRIYAPSHFFSPISLDLRFDFGENELQFFHVIMKPVHLDFSASSSIPDTVIMDFMD